MPDDRTPLPTDDELVEMMREAWNHALGVTGQDGFEAMFERMRPLLEARGIEAAAARVPGGHRTYLLAFAHRHAGGGK